MKTAYFSTANLTPYQQRQYTADLEAKGIKVRLRQLSNPVEGAALDSPIVDIIHADLFIFFSKHISLEDSFELGYAYAISKKIVVIGAAEKLFDYRKIEHYRTWQEFVESIT